jgi:hypothetical protein
MQWEAICLNREKSGGKGRASEFGDFELWKTGKRKRERKESKNERRNKQTNK